MDMRIPPLNNKIVLESNPMISIISVRRLAVSDPDKDKLARQIKPPTSPGQGGRRRKASHQEDKHQIRLTRLHRLDL